MANESSLAQTPTIHLLLLQYLNDLEIIYLPFLSQYIGSSDLVQRLQLLTIHFPKLRILWSPGPHATADLFAELKRGREEPDAAKAASISMDIIGIVLQAIFFCEIVQIC